MIAPRARMLLWVSALLPFAAATPGLPPAAAALSVMGTLLLACVVGDAIAGRKRLSAFSIQLPDVVRLSKDRAGAVPVRIRNADPRVRRIRVAVPLPEPIRPGQEELAVLLPEKSELSMTQWPCTPSQRGNYRIDQCYFSVDSPLGFWTVRGRRPSNCQVRVYPNLGADRKRLAAFFLNRGLFGLHSQRMIGKGRDFEKLREYIPGDSYDEIHWKATAKRGRPVTKIFQIERTQEVYVVLDFSRLAAKLAGDAPVLERYITAALVLGLAAEHQGDLFGLIAFSDRVHRFLRARNGKAHYHACRDALYTLEPQRVSPDFEDLCSFLRQRLRRRALLVVLTDLNDPLYAEQFAQSVQLIARQHLILVNMCKPSGSEPLFTGPPADNLDEIYQRLGGHIVWHKLRELGKVLQRSGIQFAQLSDERMSAELVSQYLSVKQRQIL